MEEIWGRKPVCIRRLKERAVLIQLSSVEEADQALQVVCEKIGGLLFIDVEPWMEFQGSPILSIWVNMRGVLAHAWNEGRTMMVDRIISQRIWKLLG